MLRNGIAIFDVQLLLDIEQRRRKSDTIINRESKTVCLVRIEIGILADDDDSHFMRIDKTQCMIDIV